MAFIIEKTSERICNISMLDKLKFIGLAVLIGFFNSCVKSTADVTTAGVQVLYSTNNAPVSGASAKLYSNLNDYKNEQSESVSMTTDASGLAKTNQALAGGPYIIWAEKGGLNNWTGSFDTILVAFTSGNYMVRTVFIGSTFYNPLVNSTWLISTVTLNGDTIWDELPFCEKDNTLEITKDYIIKELSGDSVCAGNEAIVHSGTISPGYKTQPLAKGYLISNCFFADGIYLDQSLETIAVYRQDGADEVVQYFSKQ